jgi:purine-nucleoside phosphorylase
MTLLETALSAVRTREPRTPDVALILGSGLGALADHLAERVAIPFAEIPGLPQTAVAGHAGRLIIGTLEGHTCVVLQGRLHLYEGHEPAVVVLPTRVMLGLGARTLIVSNAAGAIAPWLGAGDLMLIEDHINFTGRNPLVGAAQRDERRFPDMTAAYDVQLRALAREVAAAERLHLAHGVYAAVLGPSYETPAEIRLLGTLGADAVGMSTVPEVIVARARGVPVLGISLISNVATGLRGEPLAHEEVLAAGAAASDRFIRLLRGILRRLPAS